MTAQKLEDAEQEDIGENQNQRAFFNQFGKHSNNKLLKSFLNSVTLTVETRLAVSNILRVGSTPNPK